MSARGAAQRCRLDLNAAQFGNAVRGVSQSAVVISPRSVITAAAWTSARAWTFAGLVGISDDHDSCEVPGEDICGGVADQYTLGVLGVQEADGLADPVRAGLHPLGVVVVAGDDGPDVAVQPVICFATPGAGVPA